MLSSLRQLGTDALLRGIITPGRQWPSFVLGFTSNISAMHKGRGWRHSGVSPISLRQQYGWPRTSIRPCPYPLFPAYHPKPLILLHVLHRPPRLSKGVPQSTAPSPLALWTTRRTTAYAPTNTHPFFFIRTVGFFVSVREIKDTDELDGNAPWPSMTLHRRRVPK